MQFEFNTSLHHFKPPSSVQLTSDLDEPECTKLHRVFFAQEFRARDAARISDIVQDIRSDVDLKEVQDQELSIYHEL